MRRWLSPVFLLAALCIRLHLSGAAARADVPPLLASLAPSLLPYCRQRSWPHRLDVSQTPTLKTRRQFNSRASLAARILLPCTINRRKNRPDSGYSATKTSVSPISWWISYFPKLLQENSTSLQTERSMAVNGCNIVAIEAAVLPHFGAVATPPYHSPTCPCPNFACTSLSPIMPPAPWRPCCSTSRRMSFSASMARAPCMS